MTDKERQIIFAKNEYLLRQKAYELGYEVTLGEAWRSDTQAWIYSLPADSTLSAKTADGRLLTYSGKVGGLGSKNSLHRKRLAIDYNLFLNGAWLTTKLDYQLLGEYWKGLHPDNRWGGSGTNTDIFHFSMTDGIQGW